MLQRASRRKTPIGYTSGVALPVEWYFLSCISYHDIYWVSQSMEGKNGEKFSGTQAE